MIEAHHRIRVWFARHLLAIVAASAVLGALGRKNEYRNNSFGGLDLWQDVETGHYGWPQTCVGEISITEVDTTSNAHILKSREYSINSGWGLCLDISFAVAFMVGMWVVFSRTQRRVQRWWQISLPSLIAIMALAGILCAIWNTPSFGGE